MRKLAKGANSAKGLGIGRSAKEGLSFTRPWVYKQDNLISGLSQGVIRRCHLVSLADCVTPVLSKTIFEGDHSDV